MAGTTAPHCPINRKQVDAFGARLTAGLVLIWTGMLALVAVDHLGSPGHLLLLAFMSGDFLVRGCVGPRFSPLARLSKWTLRSLRIKPRPTNAAPKMFAAKIGLLFSILLMASTLGGQFVAHEIVAAGIAVCALLESVMGLCVGCNIYQWLNTAGILHRKQMVDPDMSQADSFSV